MTDATRTGLDRQRVPDDPAALHADVEDATMRMGETAEELGHRLDMRTRAKGAAHRVGAFGRDHSVAVAGGAVGLAAATGAGVVAWRRWVR